MKIGRAYIATCRVRTHWQSVRLGALVLLACVASTTTLFAQVSVYWDTNANTAGAGATPTGNWNATANWNTSATGTGGTLAGWTANNHAVFSAGNDAVNAYTVTLTGGISVGNITFEEGTTLITGSTLTLVGASGVSIDVASGLTATINSILGGSATLNKTGDGTFVTGGAGGNTHTGAVNINAGVFEIAKTAYVGGINNAAAVSVASGATLRLNGAAAYTQETIGPLSGAGTVTNVGAAAVNLVIADADVSTTFSGTITDTTNNLNLVKNAGTGTLTLSGANSYDGVTTISTGAVNIQNATALGTTTSGTTVASGAALEIQNNIAVGAEALSLAGTGVSNNGALRNIADTNSYAGNITLTAATEIQSDAGALTLSGNISGATYGLTFDGAGDTTVSGVIGTTTGTVTKNGTGTLTLSGTNTYTGLTDLNAGTLSINSIANLSTASAVGAPTTAANGTISIGNGATGATLQYTGSGHTTNRVINLAGTTGGATLDASGTGALVFTSNLTATGAGSKTLTLTGSSTAANTLQGTIVNNSGANTTSLVKEGTGTWVLAGGANTFTGTTAINGGTLRISADNHLGTAPGAATANKLTFDGGTLETTATFTLNANRGTTINAGGGTFDVNSGTTLTYNGNLAGSGTLTKADTGTLILGGTTTNTHTGDINVDAGTLRINKTGGANRAIGDAATVTVATGANLTFAGGQSETIGALAGGGTVDNTNATAITLTTGGNNTSTTFSGVIQDTGGNLTFTKTGTGTQTLSGTTANTFAGNLNVNDGTLALGKTAGVNAYAGSTINIGDGVGAADSAVLRLDSSNQIINTAALVFASDGRLDLNGQAETVASIAGSGEIAIGTGQLTAGNALNTVFSGELTGTTGTFTKTGSGTLTLASMINYDGVFELAAGTLSLSGITANIGTLTLTGNSTIDFAGTASLNVTNLNLNGFTLNITNWTNATDYFFAANWSGAVTDTTGVAPMNQVTFNGFAASDTKWQGYDSQVTPVPEPSTYGALLLGVLMGLFGWRRFRTRRSVAGSARGAHIAPHL